MDLCPDALTAPHQSGGLEIHAGVTSQAAAPGEGMCRGLVLCERLTESVL